MFLRSLQAIFNRRLLFFPPLLIGALVLYIVISRRNAPQQEEIPEASRPLLVIEIPRTAVVPRVLGFGTARPSEIWSAVAEVKGRIVETHAELNAGAIFRQGDTVARIDPTEYELKIAQIQAEVAQIQAQQTELDTQEVNYQDALAIEKESLRLAQSELKRVGGLRASNAVTESQIEETSRVVLSQQQSVQSLESSLKVLPSQRKALQANLEAKQAALGQAKLDLDRTVLIAPFDCRLSDVSLEKGQFVAAGQALFEAYGAAVTEVEAQLANRSGAKTARAERRPRRLARRCDADDPYCVRRGRDRAPQDRQLGRGLAGAIRPDPRGTRSANANLARGRGGRSALRKRHSWSASAAGAGNVLRS